MILERHSLHNANVSSDGMDKKAQSTDKALSCPKLEIVVVVLSNNKYLRIVVDFVHNICHLKLVFIQ